MHECVNDNKYHMKQSHFNHSIIQTFDHSCIFIKLIVETNILNHKI